MQHPGLPDCWAPIVEDVEPTSKTIQRVSTMLGAGATLDDIRSKFLDSGLTECQVFLAYKAAQVLLCLTEPYSEEDKSLALELARTIKHHPIG